MPGQSLSLSHGNGLKKGYKLIIRDGLPYYEKKQPKVAHEEHSHKLELVKDGLTFLKRGALKKRPATVAFFWLGLGLVIGLSYIVTMHIFTPTPFVIGFCAILSIMLWKRITDIGANIDVGMQSNKGHKPQKTSGAQQIMKSIVAVLSFITAAAWGLLGGAEFVHVMHVPMVVGFMVALVGLMVEGQFIRNTPTKPYGLVPKCFSTDPENPEDKHAVYLFKCLPLLG